MFFHSYRNHVQRAAILIEMLTFAASLLTVVVTHCYKQVLLRLAAIILGYITSSSLIVFLFFSSFS